MKKEHKKKLKDILTAFKKMSESELNNTPEEGKDLIKTLKESVVDCDELIVEVDKIK